MLTVFYIVHPVHPEALWDVQDTGKFELPVVVDAPTKSPDDMMDEEWRFGKHVCLHSSLHILNRLVEL